jgi:hypothetical protein
MPKFTRFHRMKSSENLFVRSQESQKGQRTEELDKRFGRL